MVANFQPVNSIQTLSQMDKVPLWMSNDALDALDRGRQADQSSLAALMAANAHEQAMNPLKMRSQELSNQTAEASLPGIVATSAMNQRKNKLEEQFFPQEVQAKLNKFALEATENEIKSLEADAQRRLYRNPNDKAALQLLQASKSMIEARQKHQNALALEGAKSKSEKDLMQMQIDAGRFKSKAGTIKGTEQLIIEAKSARERYQKLNDAATIAEQQGNHDLAESYRARAEVVRPQAEAEIAAIPKPGDINLGALPGRNPIPVNPTPSIRPGGKPGSTADNPIVLK